MTIPLPSGDTEFHRRFAGFCDSVMLQAMFALGHGEKDTLELTVEARDQLSALPSRTHVQVTIDGISEFRFAQAANTSVRVISNGIHIVREEGRIGLDLGHFVDCPESMEELRKSACYVIGARLKWRVLS